MVEQKGETKNLDDKLVSIESGLWRVFYYAIRFIVLAHLVAIFVALIVIIGTFLFLSFYEHLSPVLIKVGLA